MIRPLRQRHRRMFAVIGVLLPVAFVVGIAARQPAPSVAVLPRELAAANQFPFTIWEKQDLFAKAPVQVQWRRESMNGGRAAVSFSAPQAFTKPDLIVYWVATDVKVASTVPEGAQLLGAFGSAELRLPAEAATNEGALILFSLADQEIVDVSKPTRFNDSTK